MSWWLVATPLYQATRNGGLEWAAGADFSYGLPEEPPLARELPTVRQVLAAFRTAGCHGTPWFQVAAHDPTTELPPCPQPSSCAWVGGLDLGEVRLGVDGDSLATPLAPDQAVTDIGFRKPSPQAVLAAMVALASQAGPLLVLDDNCTGAFVVSPRDDRTTLAQY